MLYRIKQCSPSYGVRCALFFILPITTVIFFPHGIENSKRIAFRSLNPTRYFTSKRPPQKKYPPHTFAHNGISQLYLFAIH